MESVSIYIGFSCLVGLGNYGLGSRSCHLPVFVNKVVVDCSHVTCDFSSPPVAGVSKGRGTLEPRGFTGPSQKTFTGPALFLFSC